jgi:hypothetical protein
MKPIGPRSKLLYYIVFDTPHFHRESLARSALRSERAQFFTLNEMQQPRKQWHLSWFSLPKISLFRNDVSQVLGKVSM